MNILRNSRKLERNHLLSRYWSILVLIAGLLLSDTVVGEEKAARFTAGTQSSVQNSPLSPSQLEELVGPIALYPDDLIGIIMPASRKPIQVVQAVRFLDEHETDPDLTPDDTWDESIIALLNYPEVLRMMDGNLDWTVKLGQAVINQQDQVMDAIQQFRRRANAAGNLKSDDKQVVTREGDTIEIRPADPEVIYVPSYEPDQVIVSHYGPMYDYYPVGYPVYYYPYAPDYTFSSGFFWGLTTAFIVNWNTHYIHAYRSNNYRHPYYRSNYYTNRFLYPDRSLNRLRNRNDLRSTGYARRSGYDYGHRTVTIGSLPQIRQSRQIRQFGNSNQSRQIRQFGSNNQPTRSSVSTNQNSRRNASTSGRSDGYRNRYHRHPSTAGRAEGNNNHASSTRTQRRSSTYQRNRNTNPRALPHTSTAANSQVQRQSSSNNNNSSQQSGFSRHRNNESGNTTTRFQLRR